MHESKAQVTKRNSRKLRDAQFEFVELKAGNNNSYKRVQSDPIPQNGGLLNSESGSPTLEADIMRLLNINSVMSRSVENLIGMRSSMAPQQNAEKQTEEAAGRLPVIVPEVVQSQKPPPKKAPNFGKKQNKSSQPIVEQNQSNGRFKAQQNFLEHALANRATPEEISRLTKQTIGSKVYRMTDQYYWEYSQGTLNYEDMKIRFSWSILDQSYELFDTLNRHNTDASGIQLTKEKKFEVARLVDRQIRDILEYMLKKYPPSRKKIIDTDLAAKVKEVKRHTDFAYDILLNSAFNFNYFPEKIDYSKDIKRFLNTLIRQSKAQYRGFYKVMKHIFTNKQFSDGGSNLSISDLDYEIASKIHDSTAQYTEAEINSPGLKLKRPELLRILMKWLDELLTYFEKTDQKIVENKVGFKSISKGMTVNLTKKRKEVLAETMKNMYMESVIPVVGKRTEILDCLIMDLFNLTSKGFEGYESFAQKDVIISKISQYLSECIESQVVKLLSLLIHSLNSIRERFDPEVIQSSLDLVTFSVMDLLRARCIGSKQQIMRIYQSLKDHSEYFEIIKVKNKLNQSTRDLLINLKIKNSFIICELQLGLGLETQQVNDHFSHFLYELARSRFPVIMECANQIVNQDPKLTYFTKNRSVKFYGDTQQYNGSVRIKNSKLYCSKNHPEILMEYFKNENPFCCNQCNRFIEAFTYYLQYLRCHECLNVLCPQCLVQILPEFQQIYLQRYINSSFLYLFFQKQPFFRQFGSTQNLLEKALQAAKIHKYVMTCECDNEALKINIRKVHKGRLVYAFQCSKSIKKQKVHASNRNWNFILIPKNITIRSVKDLLYIQKMHYQFHWHQFDEWITEYKIDELVVIEQAEDKKVMILDFANDSNNIDEFLERQEILEVIEREAGKSEINLDLTSRGLLKLTALDVIKNKSAVKILNFWENKITDISPLKVLNQMQQLYMRDNLVTTIEPLLEITSLQVLIIQRNKLSGKLQKLNFPNLKILDISNNEYTDVSELAVSNLQHLSHLFVGCNHLTFMPNLSSCPELQIFYFQTNQFTSLDEFSKSTLNHLTKLHGCSNKVIKFPVLKFPKLDVIWLHNNQLQDISNLTLCDLPCLQLLKINNNNVCGSLPVMSFPRLLKIEIQNNELSECSNIEKWKIPELKELALNNNQFQGRIPILPFLKIKKLYLQNNKFSNFGFLSEKNNDKKYLQELQILDLSNNEFTGEFPNISIKKLKDLNLSKNKLTSLESMSRVRLPFLQIFNLQYNKLACVVPVLFLERLVELKLDFNEIQGLDFLSERQLVPKLKVLTLQGNKFDIMNEGLNSAHDIEVSFTPRSEGDSKNWQTFDQFMGLENS